MTRKTLDWGYELSISILTDLVGNTLALLHKRLGYVAKIRYIAVAWPFRIAL
jgi:hypothetical protein